MYLFLFFFPFSFLVLFEISDFWGTIYRCLGKVVTLGQVGG